jgi:L-alanine-DL-glutamate epimerase-like enolase superfamily enzyme
VPAGSLLPAPAGGLGAVRTVESWHDEALCFVRLTTSEGYVGWGQTSPYHADITATILHRQVVPWVLGADAGDVPGVVATVLEREHKFPGSHLYRAVAGVDTALWDLRGRAEGRPVAALLGAPPGTTLRAYAGSTASPTSRSPARIGTSTRRPRSPRPSTST